MERWRITLVAAFVVTALAGCGGGQATPTPELVGMGSETYTSTHLDVSYPGALPVPQQLALGIMRLEGTENAVTPEQARALLPLWQALQGGTLRGNAEVNAVLKRIEGTMTSEQLAAIAAMRLTQEDLRAWAQEQGLDMGAKGGPGKGGGQGLSPEEMATRRAEFQQLSPEARATRRAELAGLSEEERAALRATAEASGMTFGGRRFGAGQGQLPFLLEPLIELLTQRAAP